MDIYFSTLKKWSRQIFKEPHKVMFISFVFFITALPVVTFGIAFALCLYIAKLDSEGRKYKLKDVLKENIKPIFIKALVMGIIDISLFVASIVCFFMIVRNSVPASMKIMYELYIGIDIVYLVSSIYRYPVLICNESIKLSEILAKGMLITFKNLFVCILAAMVVLTTLIFSMLTGVGIILIFPGAVAFLFIHFYKQTLIVQADYQESHEYKL